MLRQVKVDILDPSSCPIRSENLICAGNREISKGLSLFKIRDSCQVNVNYLMNIIFIHNLCLKGDSGGPMVVEKYNRYFLVGITR